MCGRYSLKTAAGEIISEFNLHSVSLDLTPRYNIAPTQDVAVVRAGDDGANELALFRWGLVPFWAKDLSIGNRMINVRAETVRERPAFRTPFARRRCLVIADGFYEWQRRPDGKQPYYIHRQDGLPFAFAGIWEEWGPKQKPIRTCAILTTTANGLMRPVHDRMPVILDRADRMCWLDPGSPPDRCAALLAPCPDGDLDLYEVSSMVNSAANERPECLDRVSP